MGNCQEHAITFNALRRAMSEQAITEIGEALGGVLTGETARQIGEIAMRNSGVDLSGVIDEWARAHYVRTTATEAAITAAHNEQERAA